MTMLNSDQRTELIDRARATEGFFSEREASLLMDVVAAAGAGTTILEVGSYRGRSTLFILAAAAADARLISVDSFRTAASYAGHSWSQLLHWVDDPRLQVLPMTLAQARPHLASSRFDVVFLDGDHSLLGAAQDLALAIEASAVGSWVLCHDVVPLFPGVVAATAALCAAGVLRQLEQVESLALYEVLARPTWLTDPGVYRDEDLPPR